eukprot:gene23897-9462_t
MAMLAVLPKREFDYRNVLKALQVVHKYSLHALLKEMVEWLTRSSNDNSEDEEEDFEDEEALEFATYYSNELSYFLGVDEEDPGSYVLTWLRMTEKLQLEDVRIICVSFLEKWVTKLLKQGVLNAGFHQSPLVLMYGQACFLATGQAGYVLSSLH